MVDFNTLSELALAVFDPDRVRNLLHQGVTVTPDAVLAAIHSNKFISGVDQTLVYVESKTAESLDIILAAGANPNLRSLKADDSLSGVRESWAIGEVSNERKFVHSVCEYYPLHRAALSRSLRNPELWKKDLKDLQITLLKHGADPFALFRQPLARAQPFFGFPSVVQTQDENEYMTEYIFYEANMAELWNYNVYAVNAQAEAKANYEEKKQQQRKELGEDPSDTEPSPVLDHFGVRSVTHALLEDGGFVMPILEYPGLDLEHEDSQGRTLFLSACRSPIGADAAIDDTIEDVRWDVFTPWKGGYCHNLFPQLDHLAPTPYSRTTETMTLFQFFVQRDANLIAIDNYGKHALFHLLEAHESRNDYRPPVVRESVRYMAKNGPQLVNQPDNAGNYPIHAAVRRLRRFTSPSILMDAAELEASVHDLLEAGADPNVLDERGNSVLEYVSDLYLESKNPSKRQRRLYNTLLTSLGLELKAKN